MLEKNKEENYLEVNNVNICIYFFQPFSMIVSKHMCIFTNSESALLIPCFFFTPFYIMSIIPHY